MIERRQGGAAQRSGDPKAGEDKGGRDNRHHGRTYLALGQSTQEAQMAVCCAVMMQALMESVAD